MIDNFFERNTVNCTFVNKTWKHMVTVKKRNIAKLFIRSYLNLVDDFDVLLSCGHHLKF